MRSTMEIDNINDMKLKFGSKVILRKAGKTKVDSESSVKADNSAKEAMDNEQGDRRQGEPIVDQRERDI